jgi:CheY-like chemotaxis protein
LAEKLNFSQITALVLDADPYATAILGQILRGFGLSAHHTIDSGEEAKRQLVKHHFDLMICDALVPDMRTGDLVRWIRRQTDVALKYMPVVVLTGYTQPSTVTAMRDAGANIVVRKPVSPNVLFDRIAWSARTERPYIETETYIGPCRRFKNMGLPGGVGRRKTDVSEQLGTAVEPNMSQGEVDTLLRPTKIAIID